MTPAIIHYGDPDEPPRCYDCGYRYLDHPHDVEDHDCPGPDRKYNPNATIVDEDDGTMTPWPFGPDWAVVWSAIRRHRNGYRRPVTFHGDPISEVAP